METIDTLLLFLHIVFGAVMAVTVTLMQTTVGPAMAKIPAGDEKLLAVGILQRRAHRAMDIAIIVMTITAFYLAVTRWEMIGASVWLTVKVTFGIITLIVANLLHFYWKGKKKRLKATGRTEEFKALAAKTLMFEKVVLIGAPIAFLMGVIFNHL